MASLLVLGRDNVDWGEVLKETACFSWEIFRPNRARHFFTFDAIMAKQVCFHMPSALC